MNQSIASLFIKKEEFVSMPQNRCKGQFGGVSRSRYKVCKGKPSDRGGDVSLSRYMTLPVEQYFVLDPSQIRHIGNNRFMLKVPRINVSHMFIVVGYLSFGYEAT
eukprot:scaffold6049_cov16-Tisochrysis_lutea.AAC.4